MATNPFLEKKGFGFGAQDKANFPEHQELLGAGQYSHDLLDNYTERLVAKATRTVMIDLVTPVNLTNQSDTSATDVDLSSYTTPRTFAAIIKLYFRDSGSSSGNTYMGVRRNGDTAPEDWYDVVGNSIDNKWSLTYITCGCDKDQIIEYRVNASGAGTASNVQVALMGYIEGIWHYQQEE